MPTRSPSTHRVEDLRFDTGALWLDLVATVGNAYGPIPVERLSTLGRFNEWLAAEGLSPRQAPTDEDLVRARHLRDVLRSLGLAVAGGRHPGKMELQQLNRALADDEPRQLITGPAGTLALAAPATPAAALGYIARRAAETLGDPNAHLGACEDHDCAMLFVDPTGRRRWCSAQLCGVKHRVRAHRARRNPSSVAPS